MPGQGLDAPGHIGARARIAPAHQLGKGEAEGLARLQAHARVEIMDRIAEYGQALAETQLRMDAAMGPEREGGIQHPVARLDRAGFQAVIHHIASSQYRGVKLRLACKTGTSATTGDWFHIFGGWGRG